VSKVHGGKILPIPRLIAVLSRVNIFPFKEEVTNFIVPLRDKGPLCAPYVHNKGERETSI
jgi:hypothetical protein